MLISLLFELLDLRAVKALDLRLAASRQVVHPCSAITSVSSSLVTRPGFFETSDMRETTWKRAGHAEEEI
jgi:hypothetical protein